MLLPWSPQTIQTTQTFPWVLIWIEPHTNAFDLTYTSLPMSMYLIHSTHKFLWLNLRTTFHILKHTYELKHTCTRNHTHIYMYELKNTLYLILSSCSYHFSIYYLMYVLQQTLTLTLTLDIEHMRSKQTLTPTPTLTKNSQEITWTLKTISDSRFHYNIFADKTHDHPPFKIPSHIPDSSLRITSHLTQPVWHLNSCLCLLPNLTYPPFIFVKWVKTKYTAIHSWLQSTRFIREGGCMTMTDLTPLYRKSPL